MSAETLPDAGSKKRRIMIITADESIIEQIQNSSNASLIKSVIIESKKASGSAADPPLVVVNDTDVAKLTSQKRTRNGSLTCVVCGSPALGYNFDAITCESCKAFFRRNALKRSVLSQCRRKSGCEITLDTRRRCSACRLAKCFSSGMKPDRLLTSDEKAAKRRKIEENRSLSSKEHLPLVDQRPPSASSISLDQMPTTEELNLFRLTDFSDLLPQSSSPSLLSIEDRQRVETIQSSYEQRIELAARNGLPWNPTVHATTFLQTLNARSVPAMRLLTFFRQIPEFNQLNVDDKVTLIKYNLMPLVILNCTLSYKAETNTVVESDSDVPFDPKIMQEIHGAEIFQQVKKVFDSFVRIAQCDQRIIQLVLVVLILTKGFSTDAESSEPTLNDGMAVYRAQNYYTELLWKYMEATHGSTNAIRIFNELVAHFRSWQKLEREICLNVRKKLSSVDTNELLPIMRSLLHLS